VTTSVLGALRAAGQSSLADLSGLASGMKGSVKAGAGRVQVTLGPLVFTFAFSSLVPCVGSAHVSGEEIVLTCTTTTLPPALQPAVN
jgi:hypothetical protein